MKIKNGLYFVLFLMAPVGLLGQGLPSSLILNTNPPGADALLEGEVIANGLTPTVFPGELQGKYKLTVKEYGYETYRQTLFLHPDRPLELTLNLKPKTRFKAALRSLIIPGWGQSYSGQKAKGLFFTLLAAGSAGFYFAADNKFDDKLADYNRIHSEYDAALSESEKIDLYNALASSRQSAYDAENRRMIAIGAIIAVWGLNLADIILFFPQEKGNITVNSLTLKPTPDDSGLELVFSHKF
jgi:hypothetical protein